MKTSQMVVTSADNSLFILDFDIKKNELTFRTARNPKHKQKEIVRIQDNFVYTNLYNFHINYLQKFLNSKKNGN